jgi:hypothetical protein
VGYNTDLGQQFFDLLHEYDEYIHSYFFSVHERFYSNPNQTQLNYDEVIDDIAKLNTYNYPANLLFNSFNFINDKVYDYMINRLLESGINLKAVTVVDLELGKKIRDEFPQLEIHSSVRYFDNYLKNDLKIDPKEFINHLDDFVGIIDTVNLSGIYNMFDHDIQNRCRELGFKIKYITNEGCIRNRDGNYSQFEGLENDRCYNNIGGCKIKCTNKVVKMYPWLGLSRAHMYKENLKYIDYDILKISSRGIPNIDTVKLLLDYWTSNYETSFISGIPIYDIDTYKIFLEYVDETARCNGMCFNCRKCEKYYQELKESTEKYQEANNDQVY